jgi:branched-chain amino acid transport system substrate-binding protein
MSGRRTRLATGVAAATALLTLLAACSGNSSSGGSGGGTIKIGAIDGLTGAFVTTDVQKVATQVFDDVNAQGGINGKKIEYIVKDDAGNAQRTAQVARELVDSGVVAMAGSASFTDCDVNAGFYKQQNIDSVMGIAASPKCFQSPNIAPVNVGPFTLITAVLQYASQNLHDKKICNFTVVLPGSKDAIVSAINRWSTLSGQQLVVNDMTVQQSGDLTPYLLRAKQAGCDAVLFNPGEQLVVPWLRAAKTQGMDNVDFLLLAPAYTDSVAKAVGGLGLKVYAGTEFEPYTENNAANQGWHDTVTEAKSPATAFSQGGYLAATFMVAVLKSIKGDITRDSVDAALTNMRPIANPMLGTPFTFGPGDTHSPNQASKIVKLNGTTWTPATADFITLPNS